MCRQIAVGVLVLSAVACTTAEPSATKGEQSDDTSKPAAECIPLNPLTLDAISEQLTKQAAITSGAAVKLSQPEMNLRYIAALRIEDPTDQVGMLAMGGIKPGDSPWIAADNVAQLYLDWGAAANDGTPIKEAANRAWTSEEGTAARECLAAAE